jgi:hypothetical protein
VGYIEYQGEKAAINGIASIAAAIAVFLLWLAVASVAALVITGWALLRTLRGRLDRVGRRFVLLGACALAAGAIMTTVVVVAEGHGALLVAGVALYLAGGLSALLGGRRNAPTQLVQTGPPPLSTTDLPLWALKHRKETQQAFRQGVTNLDVLTKDQLMYLAQIEDVPGRSRMRKHELVAALYRLRESDATTSFAARRSIEPRRPRTSSRAASGTSTRT